MMNGMRKDHGVMPPPATNPISDAVHSVHRDLMNLNSHLSEMTGLLRLLVGREQLRVLIGEWETEERLRLPHRQPLPTVKP
jgi:hypothetical protein